MKHALVVDDKAENLYLLRALLEGHGWQVDEARHGAEALVRARQSPPDVVISDLLMPVMDGYTLLREWKVDERLKAVPFIVYTATYTEPQDEQLALDLGADAFVVKATEAEPFMARLHEVIAKAGAGVLRPLDVPPADEATQLKSYSEVLIHKLENKLLEVERLNQDLCDREARLRLSVEAANVGLWDWDLQTNAVLYSPEWKRQIGYCDDELSNDFAEWQSRVHPDDLELTLAKVRAFLSNPRGRHEAEFRFRHKDGSYRWIYTHADVLRDAAGKPVRMLGCHIDITERKRAEEALRESHARLKKVLEVETVGVMFWDLTTGCLTDANDAFLDLMGYSRAEVEARELTWQKLTPPDYVEASEAEIRKFQASGRVGPYEKEYLRKDGTRNWFVFAGSSLGPNACVEFCVDISARKKVEKSLRELAHAIDVAGDVVFLTDKEGIITQINEQFTALYGHTAEEVVGKVTPRILKSGKHSVDFYEQAWASLLRGETVKGEVCNRAKDGRLLDIEETITPFRDDRGEVTGFVAVQREVGARKRAEAEAQRLNAELERRVAARTAQLEAANQELEAFSYSVSHDLRAPLRHIEGFSRTLVEDYAGTLDAQGRHYLERIGAAAERMTHLIDGLLELSRVARTEIRALPVDLSAMAQAVAAELQRSEPGRAVQFVIASGLVVSGDARLLRQVLENLLGNAWKYTSRHVTARIEFGVQTRATSEPRVSSVVEAEGGSRSVIPGIRNVYFVRDDGAGFDMRHADKLFGPFQRLHGTDEYEGTGIGLATVARIIHRHGGRIWAEGAVERGATLYFTLEGGPG